MSVPGSNLLKKAFRLIAAQTIIYKAFVSRTANGIGLWNATYAMPVCTKGSVQPVPRQLMELLGLDLQKHYVYIYVSQSVVDIRRDVTSDQFLFGGATYQALSITRWVQIDGWNSVLCVEVPNA